MSSTTSMVPLDRAELVEISGADAQAFAHAQFASDVAALTPGRWQWSAWLTAQGRTRRVFALLLAGHDLVLLWLPLGGAAAMRDGLARYVLRAKVRLAIREGWSLARIDPPDPGLADGVILPCSGGYALAQPGLEARQAWLGPTTPTPDDAQAQNAWRLADIAARLPWLDSATEDRFVPQALELDRLGAVRFDKGCYPGQEIAARLHFLGNARQRLWRVVLTGSGSVAPGLAILKASTNAGVVLYAARTGSDRHEALAVVSDATTDSSSLRSSDGHEIHIAQ
jgi:tRNA-modifying protein YgfZ